MILAGTWVVWRALEPGRQAEGGDAPDVQPRPTHPALVTVVAHEGRPAGLVGRILEAVADTLAAQLELERLYTGGRVVGAA